MRMLSAAEKREAEATASSLGKNPSSLRKRISKMLDAAAFHIFIGIVVTANGFIIIRQTDLQAECARGNYCEPHQNIIISNQIIAWIYVADLILHLYVERCEFWWSVWNVVDMIVVLLGFADAVVMEHLTSAGTLPQVGVLRMLRVAKLTRLTKMFDAIPELASMLRGLLHAMKAMFWGTIMITLFVLGFSVVTVEIVYPIALDYADDDPEYLAQCLTQYSSVQNTSITFFQTLVAGDSWGSCSIPLVRRSPVAFFILGSALLCIQLGIMNLVLSAIMDSAYREHDADVEARRRSEFQEEKQNVVRLLKYMEVMDENRDGSISLAELEQGYSQIDEVRELFSKMELDTKDLGLMFDMMDTNGDGQCSYAEFIEQMQKCQSQDIKMQLLYIKLQMAQMKLALDNSMKSRIGKVSNEIEQVEEMLKDVATLEMERIEQQSVTSGASGDSRRQQTRGPGASHDTSCGGPSQDLSTVYRHGEPVRRATPTLLGGDAPAGSVLDGSQRPAATLRPALGQPTLLRLAPPARGDADYRECNL